MDAISAAAGSTSLTSLLATAPTCADACVLSACTSGQLAWFSYIQYLAIYSKVQVLQYATLKVAWTLHTQATAGKLLSMEPAHAMQTTALHNSKTSWYSSRPCAWANQ